MKISQDVLEYILAIFAGIVALAGTWFKFLRNKFGKNRVTEIQRNIEISVIVEDILKEITSVYRDVVVCSVGSVTNSAMPTNLQILNSSDQSTFQVWNEKVPMEYHLRLIHLQMMMKGDDHFHVDVLKNQMTKDWCETYRIKKVYVFNVGQLRLKINNGPDYEMCHLILYVNSSSIEVPQSEFYNNCRSKAKQILGHYKKLS